MSADRIEQIRERLAKREEFADTHYPYRDWERADAAVSTHAPSDLAFLLSRVDDLTAALRAVVRDGRDPVYLTCRFCGVEINEVHQGACPITLAVSTLIEGQSRRSRRRSLR